MVRLAAPEITSEDRKQVVSVLEGSQIAYGPTSEKFERAVASRLELGHALAVISGTAALHLALLAVGVKPGDLVLMPSLTFVAPAHAASYIGAAPRFFDSEPNYMQLDVPRLLAWLEHECELDAEGNARTAKGERIGAIVVVDLLGHLSDVGALAERVRPMGIPVVEDAAQALGATLRGEEAGAHADITCLSFNANKIVTSAGGGMLLSNDRGRIKTAQRLANQAKADPRYYVHDAVGFNYRLPSAQAALGLAQFGRLDEIIERKRRMACSYRAALVDVPGLSFTRCAPQATETNWLFTVHVDAASYGCSARRLMDLLEDRHRVETRPIFTPLHAAGVYAGEQAVECPVADRLAATGLSLPSSLGISDEELDRVCEAIRSEAPGG
ncbi:MAG: DegT/DnrJ/EryC1/StrS family protein [Solirubrobacterales bacterium]|nr:DegT/DnrJ/EryC1/StrS family protein [Solirubrobacterales bacterium]